MHRAAPPPPPPGPRRFTVAVRQGVEEQLEGVEVPPGLRAIAYALADRLDDPLCSSPAAVAKELQAVLAKIDAEPASPKRVEEVPPGVASIAARLRGAGSPGGVAAAGGGVVRR